MAFRIKELFSRRVPGAAKKRRAGAGSAVPSLLEEASWLYYLIGAIFFFAAVVLIAWRGRVTEMPRRGTIAPREIVASVDFSYPDAARAEQLARVAVSSQPFVYLSNRQVLEEQTKRIRAFSEQTSGESGRLRELLEAGAVRSILETAFQDLYRQGVLPEEGRDILLGSEKAGIVVFDSDRGVETDRAVSDVLVPAECADSIRKRLAEKNGLSPADVDLLTDFSAAMVRPTLRYDRERTALLRENARSGVGRVYTEVRPGEVLISKGDLVSPSHIVKFRAYQEEMLRRLPAAARITWLLGTALVCLIGITAFGKALRRFFAPSFFRNSRLGLMAAVGLIVLGLSRLLVFGIWSAPPWLSDYLAYVPVVPLGTIILCLLLGEGVGTLAALPLGFFAALTAGFDAGVLVVEVSGGVAAAFATRGARNRKDIFRAGIKSSGAVMAAVAAVCLLEGTVLTVALRAVAGGALGAIACALIATGLLGIVESVFRVYSDIGLLELSDMNHPLLRRMMLKAPGTHHHSLMVATLAEAAAEAIGANPLLARVGAYFHDIGKVAKPEYFIENAMGEGGGHEGLIPSMSSLILISHVKDGVDMALRHRLDRRIVDIIREHHGTSLMTYFFDRAERADQLKFEVFEKDFRYPGPRPRTPEAAIVMLADAVEAASVSVDRPTPARLETVVNTIVRERFSDGQLDESGLTLNDLKLIAATLTRNLSARYHSRIKYPHQSEEDREEGDDDAERR